MSSSQQQKRMYLLSDSKISSIIFLHKTNINFPVFFSFSHNIFEKGLWVVFLCSTQRFFFMLCINEIQQVIKILKSLGIVLYTCVCSMQWCRLSKKYVFFSSSSNIRKLVLIIPKTFYRN